MDAFKKAQFLDIPDFREFFIREEEEAYRGIESISLKYLWGDIAFFVAYTPFFARPLFPKEGSFWDFSFPTLSVPNPFNPLLPPITLNPSFSWGEDFPPSFRYSQGVAGIGGVLAGVDFRILYYNGLDRSLLFTQEIDLTNQEYRISPLYKKAETGALSLAYSYSSFTFRGEALYTPKKPAIWEGNYSITTEEFLEYSVGAEYTFFEDYRILVEFTEGRYLKNEGNYTPIFFTDLLLTQIQANFFEDALEIQLGSLVRPVKRAPGYALLGEISWDFQTGTLISIGGIFFKDREDRFFLPFRDKNLFYLRIKQNF